MEFSVGRYYFAIILNVFLFSIIYFFCSIVSLTDTYQTDIVVITFGFISILVSNDSLYLMIIIVKIQYFYYFRIYWVFHSDTWVV